MLLQAQRSQGHQQAVLLQAQLVLDALGWMLQQLQETRMRLCWPSTSSTRCVPCVRVTYALGQYLYW